MLPYISARLVKAIKFFFAFFTIFYILSCLTSFHWPDSAGPRFPPQRIPDYVCPSTNSDDSYTHFSDFSTNDTSLTESRILLLLESAYSRHGRLITQMLNASKCNYKIETFSKNLPLLTTASRGRYSTVVIENFHKYINLPKWNRELLDKYSHDYKAPIISFVPGKASNTNLRSKVKGSSLIFWQNQKAVNLRFSSSSIIPFVSRTEAILPIPYSQGREWTLFEESSLFESILVVEDEKGKRRAAAIRGIEDGVERILLGHNLTDWMIGLAFIDSIRWSTKGRCSLPSLDRYIQIDIDDIFVGSRGTRMIAQDVISLIHTQKSLNRRINNFSFLLGFSGNYFLHGDDAEDEGDRMFIEKASHFYWFPHMWRHNHAQDHNETFLEGAMTLNKQFAIDNDLSVPFPYAISPQHSGVFPVHSALYEAWSNIWNVEVTATEEYPHLRPWSDRRGFIHRKIKVLPRQTCGLYTHTQLFHLYPGGVKKLTSLIQGGELFWTIVLNQLSIFMTHQQNYAHDRLAPYTFENVLSFLQCWTRLSFKWTHPITSANRYFDLYPNEKSPIWSNPCSDPRHRSILPPIFNCSTLILPNLLVIGPQKTGTTALASFLLLHPNVTTNRLLKKSFEEVQFFSGENYDKGVEWYADLFTNGSIIMDKSATYMDNTEGIKRADALVPNANIVIILHDPAKRAYSWYQHLLARNDTSMKGIESMHDILDGDTPNRKKIRQRCISGGRYAHHLDRWMEYFPSSQIHLIDANALKDEPAKVVSDLSSNLGLPPFDFHSAIQFVPKKGFFCKISNGHPDCLGSSKGRPYPPMDSSLSIRLCTIFRNDNIALQKMLVKHRMPIPSWLPIALTEC